jgi:hypothetical protein
MEFVYEAEQKLLEQSYVPQFPWWPSVAFDLPPDISLMDSFGKNRSSPGEGMPWLSVSRHIPEGVGMGVARPAGSYFALKIVQGS